MKRRLLLALFIIIQFSTYAQRIFLPRREPFYATYNNFIFLQDSISTGVTLESNDLQLRRLNECTYLAKAKKNVSWATVKAYRNDHVLDSTVIPVNREIPLPSVHLNLKSTEGGWVWNQYRKLDSVFFLPESSGPYEWSYDFRLERPFDQPIQFKVISFTVEMVRDSVIYYREHYCNNRFTQNFRDQFPGMKFKDKVYLHDIIVEDEEKNVYIIPKEQLYFE